jgi:hypothetical protein
MGFGILTVRPLKPPFRSLNWSPTSARMRKPRLAMCSRVSGLYWIVVQLVRGRRSKEGSRKGCRAARPSGLAQLR